MSTETTWQPIETAPKDGTVIIIYGGRWGWVEAAFWQARDPNYPWVTLDSDCIEESVNGRSAESPSHWMPLPAPPVTP